MIKVRSLLNKDGKLVKGIITRENELYVSDDMGWIDNTLLYDHETSKPNSFLAYALQCANVVASDVVIHGSSELLVKLAPYVDSGVTFEFVDEKSDLPYFPFEEYGIELHPFNDTSTV